MARYVRLLKFTEKGIDKVQDSRARAAEFRAATSKAGALVEGVYWLLGEHDGLVRYTAPDDQTATSLVLALGRRGYVCTCLCRAFDEAEFKPLLARV